MSRRCPRIGGIAEAKGVEDGDGPRAHREDVAQDAAHSGRRALERLDERRVVVAFDLEGQREVAAEVDDARVLPGPLEHVVRRGRQRAQEDARVLVGAVLGPEGGEEAELGEGRLPVEAAG